MSAIYIGVMTGTSMDGVDIVAASFEPLQLHATLTVPFEQLPGKWGLGTHKTELNAFIASRVQF